ncbi:MAG TPA: choice-of-anchor D domain-containing protein [Nitrospirae bacterium]|nr:choice-of-anchor D domain-containing protein [Nitrospirota bacterium]HDL20959.1 choice-of-anchor D domain-containing protein [Nitrospirota bacterium]HDZ01554.1 choice-of-anchor D domain-containing protein [Nitrospirota bacterium]
MKKKILILMAAFILIGVNLLDAAPIKVMTYNIEAGGINPDWKQVVKEENPDVVVFVETGTWDDNNNQLLNQYVSEFNAYFVNEDPYVGSTAQNITYDTGGEAIMSRFPIISTAQLATVTLDNGSSWDPTHDFMVWQLDINGNTVYVIGSHLKCCSGATNENLRERAQEGIINYMDSLGNVSMIYAGDLNSFSPADTGALAPLGDLGYGPMTMIVDPADPTYGQYSSTVHIYTDTFRALNPTVPGYTYGHQNPQYQSRIDYIIVNQQLSDKLVSSTTGDTATANTGSDHYSVDVIINFVTGPAQVTGLSAIAVSTSQIDLSWNANTEPDLDYYNIYRDNVFLTQTTATSFSDTGLSSGTTYTYEVSAVDTGGNEGTKSAPSSATTPQRQEADISVTPSAIDFGNVTIGNSSDQIVTVGNNGLNDLIIGTVTSPSSSFSIAADNCSGQTLVFSATCTITYRFSPASAATFSSGSDIPSNDPYTPVVTVSLTGTGVTVTGPDISATPASRDFGIVAVSDVSPSQIFTVSSNGTTDLVIGGVYLTGINPYQFNLQYENCSGQTIAPSGTCTIEARYEPTKTGTMYAKIGIDSNDPDTPTLYIDLSGTGVNTTPPVADPNGPYTGVEGQAISLDASGSTDADGTITLYEWDIDNDGTFDYSSSLPTQSHTYASQDTYTINLRVTDDAGARDEATTTATISDTSPTADFTASPTSGLAPLTVNFTDNSTGYDQPLSYEWDFDNDGVIDSTVQNPSYTYNTAGTYTVSLTATDSDGSADSLTRTDYITVTACPDPVRIEGAIPVYYSTLQAAYNAAVDGDIIQSRDITFTEDLNINRSISVTFKGGYDCDYTTITGLTTLNGTLTISDGTVTFENFVVE